MGSTGHAPVILICCSPSYPKLSHFMPRDDDRVRLTFASIARQLYTSARCTGTRMTILRLHGALAAAAKTCSCMIRLTHSEDALHGK